MIVGNGSSYYAHRNRDNARKWYRGYGVSDRTNHCSIGKHHSPQCRSCDECDTYVAHHTS